MKKINVSIIILYVLINVAISSASWNLVWNEDFNGSSINTTKWEVYEGETEAYPFGDSCWVPYNVNVSNGELNMSINRGSATCWAGDVQVTRNYSGGGIGFYPTANNTSAANIILAEGRWDTRARFPNGNGTSAYMLLWPSDGNQPTGNYSEIDFAETAGIDNGYVNFTQWYGDITEDTYAIPLNITQYHNYSIEMKGGELKYYVDENLTLTQNQHFGPRLMGFSAGTWAGSCGQGENWPGCPTGTTLPQYMDIDYVRIYTWAADNSSNSTNASETATIGFNGSSWVGNSSSDNTTVDQGDGEVKIGVFADNFNDNDIASWTTSGGTQTATTGTLKQTISTNNIMSARPTNYTYAGKAVILVKQNISVDSGWNTEGLGGSGVIAVVDGNNIITLDIIAYYRGLGSNPNIVETTDLLKAMDDWRSGTEPAGFINTITTQELLVLINEWDMSEKGV